MILCLRGYPTCINNMRTLGLDRLDSATQNLPWYRLASFPSLFVRGWLERAGGCGGDCESQQHFAETLHISANNLLPIKLAFSIASFIARASIVKAGTQVGLTQVTAVTDVDTATASLTPTTNYPIYSYCLCFERLFYLGDCLFRVTLEFVVHCQLSGPDGCQTGLPT